MIVNSKYNFRVTKFKYQGTVRTSMKMETTWKPGYQDKDGLAELSLMNMGLVISASDFPHFQFSYHFPIIFLFFSNFSSFLSDFFTFFIQFSSFKETTGQMECFSKFFIICYNFVTFR